MHKNYVNKLIKDVLYKFDQDKKKYFVRSFIYDISKSIKSNYFTYSIDNIQSISTSK